MQFKLEYKRFGSHSVLIEWPNEIKEDILNDVLAFKLKLENSHVENILQVGSAYNSIVVSYKEELIDFDAEIEQLKSIYLNVDNQLENQSKLWKIPVCYDDIFGIDLDNMTLEKNISKHEIIKLHSRNVYTVYFIGFLPGFLYLGGLNESLAIPRKSSPRLKIDKGAVAIGGNQTGIYPLESPGGWNIIGNSPINFFDVKKESPCFAKAGDKIQFYAVSLKEYQDIKTLVDANVYVIEEERLV